MPCGARVKARCPTDIRVATWSECSKNYSNDSIYRDTLTPKRRAQAPVGSQLTTSPYTSFWLTDAESCLAEYRLQGTTHLEGK